MLLKEAIKNWKKHHKSWLKKYNSLEQKCKILKEATSTCKNTIDVNSRMLLTGIVFWWFCPFIQ